MGQAFDEDGRVLAEAFGKTKKEVFDQLNEAAPDAHSMMIQKVKDLQKAVKEREENKKDDLLKRWLKLIRNPEGDEDVHLLERETAIAVGELEMEPQRG